MSPASFASVAMSYSRPPSASPFPDFAQKYCARFGVPPDRYLDAVLRHTLYPHARRLRSLAVAFSPDFFAADRDFLAGVGRIHRRREFVTEVLEFQHHPANRGFLRRVLRLRVSAGRTRALVDALLTDGTSAELVFARAPGSDATSVM